MDYKEKYEQALAKAKEQYNYPCMRSCMGILEEIFPELKESEDERVRKWLITQLELKSDVNNPHDLELMILKSIAWLERQGEHANFLSKIQIGDKVTRNEDGLLVNLSQLNRVAKKNEKQGEQKPIEMKSAEESLGIDSDTYNKIVDECIFGEQKPADKVEPKFKVGDKIYLKPEYRMPDDDTPIANTVKEIRRIDDKHYRFDGSYIFIEDQDKYELVEQKPEENKGNIGGISSNWSEEDEMFVHGLIRGLSAKRDIHGHTTFSSDCIDITETINWLQSLQDRVQPQPKQEWSDEDEELLKWSIHNLTELKDRFGEEYGKVGNCIDWLQSLRPQNKWKPSGLQIEALESATANCAYSEYQDCLRELIGQLKKLL